MSIGGRRRDGILEHHKAERPKSMSHRSPLAHQPRPARPDPARLRVILPRGLVRRHAPSQRGPRPTTARVDDAPQLVREALDELMRDRTTLVIAHRLSTVRDADLIVVLDRGRIVEAGTHEDLVGTPGLYAELVSHQTRAAATASAGD